MQLRLTIVLDVEPSPDVRTRPDGSTAVALALDALASADATLICEDAEPADLAQALVNAEGLSAARRTLTLARVPDGPAPA